MTDFYDNFDPNTYEHGIVCTLCMTPLTRENVMRIDISADPEKPWKKEGFEADSRVYELMCVACTIGVV